MNQVPPASLRFPHQEMRHANFNEGFSFGFVSHLRVKIILREFQATRIAQNSLPQIDPPGEILIAVLDSDKVQFRGISGRGRILQIDQDLS